MVEIPASVPIVLAIIVVIQFVVIRAMMVHHRPSSGYEGKTESDLPRLLPQGGSGTAPPRKINDLAYAAVRRGNVMLDALNQIAEAMGLPKMTSVLEDPEYIRVQATNRLRDAMAVARRDELIKNLRFDIDNARSCLKSYYKNCDKIREFTGQINEQFVHAMDHIEKLADLERPRTGHLINTLTEALEESGPIPTAVPVADDAATVPIETADHKPKTPFLTPDQYRAYSPGREFGE